MIRREIVGRCYQFRTPFGMRNMVYADYTASGRNIRFIEEYLFQLQSSYANTHTEDDVTGKSTTELLHAAESIIKKAVNGNDSTCLIATGTGATGAIKKFQEIIGVYIPPATRHLVFSMVKEFAGCEHDRQCFEKFANFSKTVQPVVFIGPYEHHSNEISWRECLCQVVSIGLTAEGTLDLQDLQQKVADPAWKDRLKIGSFSAASNVTGMLSPVYEIAQLMHEHGGLACFDFAASAPYVNIDMNKNSTSYFDAVFISTHKFLGGPGSSGLLLFNKKIYDKNLPPTYGGGGTVDYVGQNNHDFTVDIEIREKAGTPGTIQTLRAALAFDLKNYWGLAQIEKIEKLLCRKAMQRMTDNLKLVVLGNLDPEKRIPIFSFNIKHQDRYLHPKFITRLLNDLFGIQTRAGCSCAGPYGHQLLGIDPRLSTCYRQIIKSGYQGLKPGWVRVGFHYSMDDIDLNFICDAIDFIAEYGPLFLSQYNFDLHSGAWTHLHERVEKQPFDIVDALAVTKSKCDQNELDIIREYDKYLRQAQQYAQQLVPCTFTKLPGDLESSAFFYVVNISTAAATQNST